MTGLIREDLSQGIEGLAGILYDDPLSICFYSDKIVLVNNKKEQLVGSPDIVTGQDIFLFALSLHNYLLCIEKDQRVISALEHLIFGINLRMRKGRSLPPGFAPAYELVREVMPQSLSFNLEDESLSCSDEFDSAVLTLETSKNKLLIGKSVFVSGISTLSGLARQRGLSDIFRYRNNFYCTDTPQTYQFRKDLIMATEMLK